MSARRPPRRIEGLLLVGLALGLSAHAQERPAQRTPARGDSAISRVEDTGQQPTPSAAVRILAGAKRQTAEGSLYTPGYFTIPYPNGDLPRDKGVCTDVIVRALREAGHDLQQLVHEDMKRDFDQYPKNWGLKKPDPNIDHRRVPNLVCFFKRHGQSLTLEASGKMLGEWQPGDIVCWRLDNGHPHCGIVSETRNDHGLPLVIHNLGQCCEEDCLTNWKITGHFRYPK